MINIEIHWAWLLIIISNLIVTGVYLAKEWRWAENKISMTILSIVFGFLLPIISIMIHILKIFTEYIWKEIQFYFRFYFTNYYEKLVNNKNPDRDFLKGWNELSEIWNKKYPGTLIQKRMKRHMCLINKKFMKG